MWWHASRETKTVFVFLRGNGTSIFAVAELITYFNNNNNNNNNKVIEIFIVSKNMYV